MGVQSIWGEAEQHLPGLGIRSYLRMCSGNGESSSIYPDLTGRSGLLAIKVRFHCPHGWSPTLVPVLGVTGHISRICVCPPTSPAHCVSMTQTHVQDSRIWATMQNSCRPVSMNGLICLVYFCRLQTSQPRGEE